MPGLLNNRKIRPKKNSLTKLTFISLIMILFLIISSCSSTTLYLPHELNKIQNVIESKRNNEKFLKKRGDKTENIFFNFAINNDSIIFLDTSTPASFNLLDIDYIRYKDFKTGLINGGIYGSILGGTILSLTFIDDINNEVYYQNSNSGLPSNMAIYNLIGAIGGGAVGIIAGCILKHNRFIYTTDVDLNSNRKFEHFFSIGYTQQQNFSNNGLSFGISRNFKSNKLLHQLSFYNYSVYAGGYDIGFIKYNLQYSQNKISFGVGISYGMTIFELEDLYDDIYGSGYGFRIEPIIGFLLNKNKASNIWINFYSVLPLYKNKQFYNKHSNNIENPEHYNVMHKQDKWVPCLKINLGVDF